MSGEQFGVLGRYGGLLGFLSEAADIQKELGVSAEEAHTIQRERAAERESERLREATEFALAQAESNVLPFRAKH
jgi:hypothetical protein